MKFYIIALSLLPTLIFGQYGYWQQEVDYTMDIVMDVEKNQYQGTQTLEYTNNSPDTLNTLYYHLYFNAFQPGSGMDMRNQSLPDSDPRITDRISKLKDDEIGYHDIQTVIVNGKVQEFKVEETILVVKLNSPILPNTTATIDMSWESQIPVQIRRSGRDNAEGIRYSMSQWYPKICEYDYMGWHPNPYIGREFHSPWGDWEVNITIDKDYVLGATGMLMNANQVGKGYQAMDLQVPAPIGETLTWNFKAENVIDFVWAADPDYKVLYHKAYDGTRLYFLYQANEKTVMNWARLPRVMDKALQYMEKHYGEYQYDQYSFIQGGDGGMEYPMATLITGERTMNSLIGVSVHEWMHSWYQFMLATNEALYPWMDEGFTSYATNMVVNHLKAEGVMQGEVQEFPLSGSYASYLALATSGKEEPLITHADHYSANTYYGIAAYSKGAVFLSQLEYILGQEVFAKALLDYFNQWKFKHPTPYDFIRVMEKNSGMVLDWYQEYFVNTTRTIDYKVADVGNGGFGKSTITLERIGMMPMPLDVRVTYKDGGTEVYTIPLDLMRGHKSSIDEKVYGDDELIVLDDWQWVANTYEFDVKTPMRKITKVEIDPSKRLADVDSENDTWEKTD